MDKRTRLSVINEYEKGGLKMIDLETMIKSFSVNDGAWKDYIRHQLKRYGGLFLFHCNYNVKDHPIPSQFYAEMLQWWAEFRDEFSTEKDWQGIIWNNKDVRINNAPVFYKSFFESGIICVNDPLFDLNNLNSYNIISKHVGKVNFLTWAGLRHAIPSHLKMSNYTFMTRPPTLAINDKVFNVLKKKSKDYYSLLLSKKAQFLSGGLTLKHEFDLTGDELQKAYILSHSVCCEPYI